MILTLDQHGEIDRLIQNEINECYHKFQKDNCEGWKSRLRYFEYLKKEWNDGNKFSIDFNFDLVNKDYKPAFDEAVNLVKKYMKKASDAEIDNFLLKMKFDEKIKEKNDEIETLESKNKVLEARITILDAENQEQYEENERLQEQLKQVPDETKTTDMKEIAKKCRCGKEDTESSVLILEAMHNQDIPNTYMLYFNRILNPEEIKILFDHYKK